MILDRIFGVEQRHTLPRTIEGYSPTSPLWGGLWGLGTETAAGQNVNESTALALSAVWACARLISETVAGLPLSVYLRQPDGDRIEQPDHPAALALRQPNPDMTALGWRETIVLHLLLWGNAYTEILWAGDGTPVVLWPIHPTKITPKSNGPRGGVRYTIRDDNHERLLPARSILHFAGPLTDNGIEGKSVIACAREQLGEALAAQQFAGSFWQNGAVPATVLRHPGKLKDPAKLRRNWEAVHKGTRNAGKTAVLEEGMEVSTLGMPLADAQFIESRQFHTVEICRWFRVAPHKVQNLDRATFSNIEEQERAFASESVLPWCNRIEAELDRKLLQQPARFYTRHRIEGLLRATYEARMKGHQVALQSGIRSINEVRQLEDMNKIGPEGDKYYVPLNMTTADKIGAEPEAKPEPEADTIPKPEAKPEPEPEAKARPADHDEVFRAACSRLVYKESKDARHAAEHSENFVGWIDQRARIVAERFRNATQAALDAIGQGDRAETIADWYATQFKTDLLEASEVRTDDLAASVGRCCDMWEATRYRELQQQLQGTGNG